MGKWANERRRLLFEKLKAAGKLEPPKSEPKPKPKPKPKLTPAQQRCCLYKFGSNLPEYFVPCGDCRVNGDKDVKAVTGVDTGRSM